MTRVLDLIRCQLERNNTKFFVRVKDMEEADWELFEQKILTFEGKFVPQSICPDCGNPASVTREKRGDEEVTYLYCEECSHLGHQEIPYQEVDLFTFNYRNFRLYINNPDIEGEYVESAAQCLPSNLTIKENEPLLSRKKDDLRRTAVALMKRVKKDTACTWSEAEDTVQKAMWKEFVNCGLRVSKNNFHSLRYNNNYSDVPEADDSLMQKYSLLTIREAHRIQKA